MANFDRGSITGNPLSTADASAIFYLKKNLSNPFYLWTSAEIDFAFFYTKKVAGAKRYLRLRSNSFCDQQCFSKTATL